MAQVREFMEETGMMVEYRRWKSFLTLRGKFALDGEHEEEFSVEFFSAAALLEERKSWGYKSRMNDINEHLQWYDINDVLLRPQLHQTMPNVTWMLPMARSFALGERASAFTVTERYK